MHKGMRYGTRITSRFGDVHCVVDEAGALVRLDFVGAKDRAATDDELGRRFTERGFGFAWDAAATRHVAEALERYFAGEPLAFDLARAPEGTDFQLAVWDELARVPYGRTVSYAELARRIGRPGAARAVGRANATNPISIVVPCHRVVGAGGALTGYAGGVDRKRELLAMEAAAASAVA